MKTLKQLLQDKGSNVYTVRPSANVFDSLRIMSDKNIGALVVIDGDAVVGLLSERDYTRKGILMGRAAKNTPVRDIMTSPVICVSPEQSVDACIAIMTEKRVRHLPVLADGQLVGILSIGDALKTAIEDRQFTIEQLEHYISGTP